MEKILKNNRVFYNKSIIVLVLIKLIIFCLFLDQIQKTNVKEYVSYTIKKEK